MKSFKSWLIEYQWLIRIIFYFIITIACTVYIVLNWYEALEFTFLTNFNGMNLLFIVWIVLLLLPIVGNLEAFGLKLNFWEQQIKEEINDRKRKSEEAMKLAEEAMKLKEVSKQTIDNAAERSVSDNVLDE